MLSSQIIKLTFLRPHLHGGVSALAVRLKSSISIIDSQCPPVKTRPKRPIHPFQRFKSERIGLSEMHKDIFKKWKEMTDEEKRPFVEQYEALKKQCEADNASIMAQLKAVKKSDKRGHGNNSSGCHLFISEVKIPYDPDQHRLIKAAEMWMELTEEERNAYNEKAKDLNEKGVKELVAAAIKKVAYSFRGKSPYSMFLKQSLPEAIKIKNKEVRIEWEGLSNEEKSAYTERYEEERQQYQTNTEEYKEGPEFKARKKAMSIIMAKIKKIEKEMNKPKLGPTTSFMLYIKEMKEMSGDNYSSKLQIAAGKNWKAMSEEEKAVYKRRWEDLKSKWQEDVAEWELKNADSPKMSELKVAVRILKSQQDFKSQNYRY